jgi:hypothetical protein
MKRFLSKLPFLGTALGDVLFETPPRKGQVAGSLLQWRVKQAGDGKRMFIGMKLKPDRYAGLDGAVTNYLELTISDAEQAKADLERCIVEYYRRKPDATLKS